MVKLQKREGLALKLIRGAIREAFFMEFTTWGWTGEKNGGKGLALDEDRTNKPSQRKEEDC